MESPQACDPPVLFQPSSAKVAKGQTVQFKLVADCHDNVFYWERVAFEGPKGGYSVTANVGWPPVDLLSTPNDDSTPKWGLSFSGVGLKKGVPVVFTVKNLTGSKEPVRLSVGYGEFDGKPGQLMIAGPVLAVTP